MWHLWRVSMLNREFDFISISKNVLSKILQIFFVCFVFYALVSKTIQILNIHLYFEHQSVFTSSYCHVAKVNLDNYAVAYDGAE